jgi:F0F1-type ATP synthase membrane subunit b/b'
MWIEWLLYIDIFLLGVASTAAVLHWYHRLRGNSRTPDPRLSVLTKSDKQQIQQDAREQFKQTLNAAADRLEHDLKATTDRISLHLEELGNQTADIENKRYRQQLDGIFNQAETDVAAARSSIEQYIGEYQQSLESLHQAAKQDIEQTKNSVAAYADHHEEKMELLLAQATKTITDSNQHIVGYRDSLQQRLEQLDQMSQNQIVNVNQEVDTYKEQLKQQLQAHIEQEKQWVSRQLDDRFADVVMAFLNQTMQRNVDLGSQTDYLIATLEENKDKLIKGVAGDTATPQ